MLCAASSRFQGLYDGLDNGSIYFLGDYCGAVLHIAGRFLDADTPDLGMLAAPMDTVAGRHSGL